MTPATATAIALAGVGTAAGEIYAANKASGAQTQAAQTQATANTQAAQLQAEAAKQAAAAQLQASEDALNFAKQQYATLQGQMSPYIGVGQGALNKLAMGLGVTPVAQPPLNLPTTVPMSGATTGSANMVRVNPVPSGSDGSTSAVPPGYAPPTAPGQPQLTPSSTQSLSTSSVRPAAVGDQRFINGMLARWDGQGWEAV